jgi:hypothetical protein
MNGNAIKLQWLIKGFKSQKKSERKTWHGEGGKRIFQILNSSRKNKKIWGSQLPSRGKKGQTLTGFLRKYFLQETVSSKKLFGPDLLTNWEPATLFNPTKVGERHAFPLPPTALFAATGNFPFTNGKTHCALNCAHISVVTLRD